MSDYDGKTADERRSERRERLIEAGLELFGTVGLPGTSIRAVLRQAGLHDRYFSESFPSLDALLAAVVRRIYEEELLAYAAEEPVSGARADQFRVLLETVTRLLEQDPRKARVKFIDGAGPEATSSRRFGLRRHADIANRLLPPAAPGRAVDVPLVAVALVAGINELFQQWLEGAPFTRQHVIDQGVFLFEAAAKEISRPAGR